MPHPQGRPHYVVHNNAIPPILGKVFQRGDTIRGAHAAEYERLVNAGEADGNACSSGATDPNASFL